MHLLLALLSLCLGSRVVRTLTYALWWRGGASLPLPRAVVLIHFIKRFRRERYRRL